VAGFFSFANPSRFFFSFAKPSDFWFGLSQKGTICSSELFQIQRKNRLAFSMVGIFHSSTKFPFFFVNQKIELEVP
jgi:hypothetical protein